MGLDSRGLQQDRPCLISLDCDSVPRPMGLPAAGLGGLACLAGLLGCLVGCSGRPEGAPGAAPVDGWQFGGPILGGARQAPSPSKWPTSVLAPVRNEPLRELDEVP